MNNSTVTASILPRVTAKAVDYLLAAAMMETIPRVGFYMGILYVLVGDSFFGGASVGKRLMGLRVAFRPGMTHVKASILRNSTVALAFFLWKIPIIGWIFFAGITLLEFIIMIGNAGRKRIGDELAGTSVYEIASIDKGDHTKKDAGNHAPKDAGDCTPDDAGNHAPKDTWDNTTKDAGDHTPNDAGGRTPEEEK